MLKTSSVLKTSIHSANRDTCNPDPGEFAKVESRIPSMERGLDRLLNSINENAIQDHAANSPKCDSRQLDGCVTESAPTREELAMAEIDALLRNSGTATQHVHCDVEEAALILTGRVRRYHHLQIVLQIAMRCREGREIVNKIGVDTNLICE